MTYDKSRGFQLEGPGYLIYLGLYLSRKIIEILLLSLTEITYSMCSVVFLLTVPRRFLCCSFFVCVSTVSYVAFVLSLFVPHLSFFWCLGNAVHPVIVSFSGYLQLYFNISEALIHFWFQRNKRENNDNFTNICYEEAVYLALQQFSLQYMLIMDTSREVARFQMQVIKHLI